MSERPSVYADRGRGALAAAILIGVLAIFGFAFLGVRLVGFDSARDLAVAHFGFRGSRYFVEPLYEQIVSRTTIVGTLLIGLAGIVAVWRKRVGRGLVRYTRNARDSGRELGQDVLRAIRSTSKAEYAALLLILAVGLVVRLYHMTPVLLGDEFPTVDRFASKPLIVGISVYSNANNHVLNTLLIRLSTLIFGPSVIAIRLPVLAAGLIAIVTTYAAMRFIYGPRTGIFAAAFVAASSDAVLYSISARGHMFVLLFFLLSLSAGTYGARKGGSAAWSAYALALALGFYAVPTMLYGFAALGAWLVGCTITEHDSRAWARKLGSLVGYSVVAGLMTLFLYSPVLAVSGPERLFHNDFVVSQDVEATIRSLPWFFGLLWEQWHTGVPTVATLVLVAGVVISSVAASRTSRFKVPLLPLALLGLLLLVLVHRRSPSFPRNWLFLLPVYAGAAFAGLGLVADALRIPEAWKDRSAALLSVLFAACLAASVAHSGSISRTQERRTMFHGEELAAELAVHLRPGDLVLTRRMYPSPFEYYITKQGLDPAQLGRASAPYNLHVGSRVFLVTNPPVDKPGQILAIHGFTPSDFSSPEQIISFEHAAIFVTRRIR